MNNLKSFARNLKMFRESHTNKLKDLQCYELWRYDKCLTQKQRQSETTHLLSSFPSIRSWVWLALVLAEKTMNSGRNSLGILEVSLSAMVRVLPVPVGPTHNTWKEVIKYSTTNTSTMYNLPKETIIPQKSTKNIILIYFSITVFLFLRSISKTWEVRIVSIVGTMMSENLVSGGMLKSGTPCNQFLHWT